MSQKNIDKKEMAEWISEYAKLFLDEFFINPLFHLETELEVKTKGPMSTRFQFFISQAPYFIKTRTQEDIKRLFSPVILEFLLKRVIGKIISPMKSVFTDPGRVSIKEFIKDVGLKGEDFILLTADLERTGYLDVNLRDGFIRFMVNKIEIEKTQFLESMTRTLKALPRVGEVENQIRGVYVRSKAILESQFSYPIYEKIIQKSVIVDPSQFNFAHREIEIDQLTNVYQEALLLLHIFYRRKTDNDQKKRSFFENYSCLLSEKIIKFLDSPDIERYTKEMAIKALGCLSFTPGKSLQIINVQLQEAYKNSYENFRYRLHKVY